MLKWFMRDHEMDVVLGVHNVPLCIGLERKVFELCRPRYATHEQILNKWINISINKINLLCQLPICSNNILFAKMWRFMFSILISIAILWQVVCTKTAVFFHCCKAWKKKQKQNHPLLIVSTYQEVESLRGGKPGYNNRWSREKQQNNTHFILNFLCFLSTLSQELATEV